VTHASWRIFEKHPGEPTFNLPQIFLQAAHHHLFEELGPLYWDAATKPLRIEDLQQGRKAI
jgi:hypothetical protein